MAARLTKLELQQSLNALGAEVQALRLENAELKATLALRPAAKPARPAYTPRPPSPEQLVIRAAMAAAKAQAMASGTVVRV
jgi:regulator of replication initiation timing